jgi:hypothetical protein
MWTKLIAMALFMLPLSEAQDSGELVRLVAGFEQAGAVSASPVQKAFLDFYFSNPFTSPRGSRLGIWGDVRFGSSPQQTGAEVQSFPAAAIAQFGQIKVNQLVKSGELLAGLEYRLSGNITGRTTLHAIAAFGALMPANPQDATAIFEKPDQASSSWMQFARQFPQATGDKYQAVAFVTKGRDRFFREYYTGLRFESHYLNAPPHTVDIVIGQNEAVTGGGLHGAVVRMDAFYPLPSSKVSFIYLFASGVFKISARSAAADPLLLQSSVGRTLYDPDVFVATVPGSNRDFYRIGIGLDLLHLFR